MHSPLFVCQHENFQKNCGLKSNKYKAENHRQIHGPERIVHSRMFVCQHENLQKNRGFKSNKYKAENPFALELRFMLKYLHEFVKNQLNKYNKVAEGSVPPQKLHPYYYQSNKILIFKFQYFVLCN